MPPDEVDYLEAQYPGFLLARLTINTSRIHGNLAKRYAVPFAAPGPEIVIGWLVAMTQVDGYDKRGWDPADEQSARIIADRTTALAELKEAADAEHGLFELPLREDLTAGGVTRGGPLAYSEPSPYDWSTVQMEALRGR